MIYVECQPDEFLITSLGFAKKQIKHVNGKGNVIKKVNKDKNAVGIIDEDPASSQPKAFGEYKENKKQGDIKLLIHKDNQDKKIILISPRLEEWLLKRASTKNIKSKDYGLPDDGNKLHRITQKERRANFKDFLTKLIGTQDGEISTIKEWLKQALN